MLALISVEGYKLEARGVNGSGSSGNGVWIDRGGNCSTNASNVNTLDTKADPSTEKLLNMTTNAEYAEVFGPANTRVPIMQTSLANNLEKNGQDHLHPPAIGGSLSPKLGSPMQGQMTTPVAYATTNIIKGRNVSKN